MVLTTHDVRPAADGDLPTSRPMLTLFIGGVTAVGVTAAGISFRVIGGNPSVGVGRQLPALWPPDWLFWAVWLVIYPASSVAAYRLWQRRRNVDVRGPLTAFALMNVASAMFLPISAIIGGTPSVLALMDINGVIEVYALAWLFSRYSDSAARWLTPYLIWMPLTATLKIWLWAVN